MADGVIGRLKDRLRRVAWDGRDPYAHERRLEEIEARLAPMDGSAQEIARLRQSLDWLAGEYPQLKHDVQRVLSGAEWLYPRVQRHETAVESVLEMKPEFTDRLSEQFLNTPTLASLIYPIARDTGGYVVERRSGETEIAPDGLPMPPWDLCSGYGVRDDFTVDAEKYINGGRTQTERMRGVLEGAGFRPRTTPRVLDFGCATGRMLRHLADFAERGEAWGVDVSSPGIAWAQTHLSPPFRFATTPSAPPLPFETGTFDLVYAGSVFTHMAELTDAWLLELRRITCPGGMLYLTFFDDDSLADVFDREKWPENKARGFIEAFDRKTGVLNKDYAYFVYDTSPKNTRIVFRSEFLRQKLEQMFEVRRVEPRAYGWQTAWVLVRPDEAEAPPDAGAEAVATGMES